VSSFSQEVAAGVKLAKDANIGAVRATLLSMARRVIQDTPVDTGRLKNNWYASNRGLGRQRNRGLDPSGANSLKRVVAALQRLKVGQAFYLYNNLPYARVVEFGLYPNPPKNPTGKTVNGFSRQAPAGMLRINFNSARVQTLRRGRR
jgi:hypothetical protein